MTRPTWDEYFLNVAQAVANRADCTRRMVGAVIADQEHRVISTGYNGAPSGAPGCLTAGACERGRHYRITVTHCASGCDSPRHANDYIRCACGNAWPCASYAEPGSSYDTGAGSCSSVHAEANALLYARRSLVGCTMYVTAKPCDGCKRLIRAAKLADVVYRHDADTLWAYDCETLVDYHITRELQ